MKTFFICCFHHFSTIFVGHVLKINYRLKVVHAQKRASKNCRHLFPIFGLSAYRPFNNWFFYTCPMSTRILLVLHSNLYYNPSKHITSFSMNAWMNFEWIWNSKAYKLTQILVWNQQILKCWTIIIIQRNLGIDVSIYIWFT